MELEEAKRIINDFIMYCRFNEKRKYSDEQLFEAMKYFAFKDFIPKTKIESRIEELDLEIDEEYEKSMAYHQLLYARCELKNLLEDK